MNQEELAMQKIAKSFLAGNGPRHCQPDKDLMVKYLLQKVVELEARILDLESKHVTFGASTGLRVYPASGDGKSQSDK